ncbi:MAG: penicillin-binding protein [Anaerolineaceae bacterium]|nr:penicillin-binding protein [Anaerolineaceae bacterium]
MRSEPFPQEEMLRQRLPVISIVLVVVSIFLLGRLMSFQLQLDPTVLNYLESVRNSNYSRTLRLAAARGNIFDRDMQALAVNTLEYRVGISPNLVSNPRELATQLAGIMGLDELETFQKLSTNSSWELLAPRVSAEVGHQLTQLNSVAIQMDPIPRRSYPQGTLASHVVGFVGGDLIGYYGVEGFYQSDLAGRERDREVSNIPFVVPEDQREDRGADLILTIDREMQFLAEAELQQAVAETGSTEGTIIIMNPRNGEILAMANYPSYDPNAYYDVNDPSLLANPAIGEQYEPGSVMKVLTIASALELGIVGPNDTYLDQGALEAGGIRIENWDRQAHGVVDMTGILVQSLNVGAATVSLDMGPLAFYGKLRDFGFGRPTGVDLQGEAPGTMYVPGDEDYSDSQLLTNSFGQGIAVTPLQMLTAVSAIANDGLMMQPHVFKELIDDDRQQTSEPSTLGRPISEETARLVTEMMVAVVNEGLDGNASLPGYSIAGKTGTAQIPTPIGYEPNASIVSFVGFLPADDPQVSVLVKLNRPSGYWGSQVAAPVFQRLAERLVILLKIPPDDIRWALQAEGGVVNEISR